MQEEKISRKVQQEDYSFKRVNKKKETMSFAARWMDLETGKVSQKDKYNMITLYVEFKI